MEIVFLGHQSWLIQVAETKVLVDPVIKDTIGLTEYFGAQVYPPRNIDASALADITAIVLSHEHSDHFDIDSLRCLPRVTVFMSSLLISPIEEILNELGFTVVRINTSKPIRLPNLILRLFQSHPKTAFWESRVTQVYFEDLQTSENFLIGVDALVSELYLTLVESESIPPPDIIAISNNSQIPPPGITGSLSSCVADQYSKRVTHGLAGLKVIRSLKRYIADIPRPHLILICGGGFMKNSDDFGPFPFSDQNKLAEIMSRLDPTNRYEGLLPGESISLNHSKTQLGKVDWITLDEKRLAQLAKQKEDYLTNGARSNTKEIYDHQNPEEVNLILDEVKLHLNKIAPAILLSSLGNHLIRESLIFGDKPFSIHLKINERSEGVLFSLNIFSAEFETEKQESQQPQNDFPYGLEMRLNDFYRLIRGDVQIWDLAGTRIKSWFRCPIFEGPVPFLYSYYGENTSPNLARNVYHLKMNS